MFTVRLTSAVLSPSALVTIRTERDWDADIPGLYERGGWTFLLPSDGSDALEFKFVLHREFWMTSDNCPGIRHRARSTASMTTRWCSPRRRNMSSSRQQWRTDCCGRRRVEARRASTTVIVVGSGTGGGVLADQLSDGGAEALL